MPGPATGSIRPGSFTAKLASLLPGQTITLDDQKPEAGPTRLERAVQTAMTRTPAMAGRAFTTERVLCIRQDWTTTHALRITRKA